jgi:hypothetical protein
LAAGQTKLLITINYYYHQHSINTSYWEKGRVQDQVGLELRRLTWQAILVRKISKWVEIRQVRIWFRQLSVYSGSKVNSRNDHGMA